MTSPRRAQILIGLAAASTLALAGCASATTGGNLDSRGAEGPIVVVASTNVYGQIAEEIGGDLVDVTSIIASGSQDPHSFEASARDQLTLTKADLIIENGGGYDSFIDALIESSGTDGAVVTAVEFSHDHPDDSGHEGDQPEDDHSHDDEHDHIEGFNEHVWYDADTMGDVAEEIADELAELRPDDADTFSANATAFLAQLEALDASLADLDAAHGGEKIFVTEPVPVYLARAAGLVNETPDAFSEAVEEGQDVPPATLLEAFTLLREGDVRVVITNAQTGGDETTRIVDEAKTLGIPVIAFSELLPEGQTYISWMQENVDALAQALAP